MTFVIRQMTEQDWRAVRALAYMVDPDDSVSNEEWFRNRIKFDTTRYVRKHYIVEDDAAQQVIGYGSIEQGPGVQHYRMFLVIQPGMVGDHLWQILFARLMDDAKELKATKVWAREYGHGNYCQTLDFLRTQGFVEVNRVKAKNSVAKEVEVVRVERNL